MGVGHASAARAIETALDDDYGDVHATTVDSYRYAARVVSGVVSSGYLRMVQSVPQMYRYFYGRAEKAHRAGRFRRWAQATTATNLRALLVRERPDVVVCTHAFPCGAMAEYKRRYPRDAPSIVGGVTDFGVHAFWAHDNVDAYIVAHEGLRDLLMARGVARDRIAASGIPVHARFADPASDRVQLRERLHIPKSRAAVLVMGGGLGIGPIEGMLTALEPLRERISAVVLTGRNPRLLHRLQTLASRFGFPMQAISFTQNVAEYMRACDVLLSKPGGLSMAEALVARIPILLFRPLPGQEERNAQFLVAQRAALWAADAAQVAPLLERVLDDPLLRRDLLTHASELSRPQAAHQAADVIAHLADVSQEVVA